MMHVHMYEVYFIVLILTPGYTNEDCKYGDIRLVDGNIYEGRVEVCVNNQWGTVCDDLWDTSDAEVVCKQLGLEYSNADAYTDAFFGEGTGPIWLDNVQCIGSEKELLNCSNNGIGNHNCGHNQDAGVECFTNESIIPSTITIETRLSSETPITSSTAVVIIVSTPLQIAIDNRITVTISHETLKSFIAEKRERFIHTTALIINRYCTSNDCEEITRDITQRQTNITVQPSDITILHTIESSDGLRVTYHVQTQSGAMSSSSLYGAVIEGINNGDYIKVNFVIADVQTFTASSMLPVANLIGAAVSGVLTAMILIVLAFTLVTYIYAQTHKKVSKKHKKSAINI